jgi:hypothetical protein
VYRKKPRTERGKRSFICSAPLPPSIVFHGRPRRPCRCLSISRCHLVHPSPHSGAWASVVSMLYSASSPSAQSIHTGACGNWSLSRDELVDEQVCVNSLIVVAQVVWISFSLRETEHITTCSLQNHFFNEQAHAVFISLIKKKSTS